MEVVLLGTGSADGWPNPFCTCTSCTDAGLTGVIRGQTAALIDDVLMLDCGPEAPRAAARAGRCLARVSDLFLTHSHPDHTGPAALLWRSWAGREEPLTVHGPEEAVEACRPWVGPGDPVRLHAVAPGELIDTGRHRVRALAANHGDHGSGAGLLWDVTGVAGGRLLYATDTGWPPPATLEELRSAQPYDVVLLEETFGDRADLGTDHLHLGSFGRLVAELRAARTIVASTQVVAVHLGHHNPAPATLDVRLAALGARAGRDGEVLATADDPTSGVRVTFVLGGARSGKSALAERLVGGDPDVTYVATGGCRDDDPEWVARVAQHRERRPAAWRTVETTDLAGVLRSAPPGTTVLVDCATLWLTDVFDRAGAWTQHSATDGWSRRVAAEVEELAAALVACRARVVLVSNEVGQGVVPSTASGRLFRDELGRLNVRLAEIADRVVFVTVGLPTVLKGPGWQP